MRSKLLLLGFLSFAMFIGCNDEKKATSVNPVEVEKPSKTFNVIVDANIKKDDKIMVYYQDQNIPYFSDDYFVEQGIIGHPEDQKIKISVPEEFVPYNIRIDISSVAGQEPIKLNNITLEYLGRSFVVESAYLKNFFTWNEYIKFDENTKMLTLSKKSDGTYDPVMLTTEPLIAEIGKIIK